MPKVGHQAQSQAAPRTASGSPEDKAPSAERVSELLNATPLGQSVADSRRSNFHLPQPSQENTTMFQLLSTFTAADILQPAQRPEDARQDAGAFGASLTLVKGTVIGKKTSDNKLYAYTDANTDGTGVAVGILMIQIVTDSSGNVFYGTSSAASETNPPHETAPFWQSGIFDTSELTGYDAAALTDLKGARSPTASS
jgi:hypothetical protein